MAKNRSKELIIIPEFSLENSKYTDDKPLREVNDYIFSLIDINAIIDSDDVK